MLNTKKGVEMSLKAVVELILAAIIILGTVVLLNMIFNSFSADDYSLENFNSLGGNTLSLIQTNKQFSTKIMPYHISSDYILVGFSSEWENYKDINVVNNHKKISKPNQCIIDEACLCIYEEKGRSVTNTHGNDFDGDSPVSCINLGTNVYISGADSYEQHFGNDRQGIDEDMALRQARKRFIIQTLYYKMPGLDNPDNVFWDNLNTPEEYFPNPNEVQSEIEYNNMDWFMSYLLDGQIEDSGDYESRYDYDDEEQKDGVIDGYPYMKIYNEFSFNNLFPLNHEYLILYGKGNGEKSGCNIVAPYDKDNNNPIDDCADSQDYEEFGTRNLYIEKFVNETSGNTHILIAPYEGMILGRYYSSESFKSFLYDQAQTVLGNCPFSMDSIPYSEMETVSIDYKDIVTDQISSNSYDFEPELVYSIIFEYGTQEDYNTLGQYGLLRIFKEDAISICQIQETLIETELLDPDINIECGLKVLQTYYVQVEQTTNLDSNEIINNTLALFYSRDSTLLDLQDSEPLWKSDEESLTFDFVSAINEYNDCLLFSNTLLNPWNNVNEGTGEIGDVINIENIDCSANDCRIGENTLNQIFSAKEIAMSKGLDISITSAYRSPAIQMGLFISNGCNRASVCGVDIGTGSCSLTNPSINDPSDYTHCPHASGGAVDLYIYNLDGTSIDLGVYSPYNSATFTDIQKENHQKLQDIMCQVGFIRYGDEERTNGEWWHFEYGTSRWERGKQADVCTLV